MIVTAPASGRCYNRGMHRFEISLHHAALAVYVAALAALVYAEGWIWPLKAAAVMIPVSLLIG
jgi:hypothetical protein